MTLSNTPPVGQRSTFANFFHLFFQVCLLNNNALKRQWPFPRPLHLDMFLSPDLGSSFSPGTQMKSIVISRTVLHSDIFALTKRFFHVTLPIWDQLKIYPYNVTMIFSRIYWMKIWWDIEGIVITLTLFLSVFVFVFVFVFICICILFVFNMEALSQD